MKTLLVVILLLLAAVEAPAQVRGDSTASQARLRERSSQKFLDEDGDGIDDRTGGQGKQRRKDTFIDRDKDGICDDRAHGLGFRRGRGMVKGGKGPAAGKGQGSGGKR